ncbi:MAG TPA: hypothetical protein VFE11_01790 [Dongiaceae bacterium]|jgi:hypothetical protein|nr:hypothetical protein [Dongiaceae bacterium]
MTRAVIVAVLMGLAACVSGCASAVRGTSQTIHVGSTPEGAECTFTREGATVATTTTPGAITVKRERKPINVVCTKAGHEEARAVMNATTSPSPYVPLVGIVPVVGAVAAVGSLADAASGANNHYQTALMVKLEPMSAADLAAAATRPPPAAPAATAPPAVPSGAPAPAGQPPAAKPALNGPWRARNVLIADRSAGTCSRDGGEYSLDISGDTFTVENINGRMLVTTLPADGAVDQPFRSPSGARLAVVGNARTRELEIVNSASGCRWQLMPLS